MVLLPGSAFTVTGTIFSLHHNYGYMNIYEFNIKKRISASLQEGQLPVLYPVSLRKIKIFAKKDPLFFSGSGKYGLAAQHGAEAVFQRADDFVKGFLCFFIFQCALGVEHGNGKGYAHFSLTKGIVLIDIK